MIHVNVRKRPDRINLQLAWTDPLTGNVKTKSARTKNWKAAERAAAKWESELQQVNGQVRIGWENFRVRFEDEHLISKRQSTQDAYMHALNKFEKLVGRPKELANINSSVISQFSAALRKEGLRSESIATYLRHVRSALGWASKIGLINSAPRIMLPTSTGSRGRPLTLPEVWRYLTAVKQMSPTHPELLTLVKVCWLGGLRINEALTISFDSAPIRIDFNRQYPTIVWSIDGQKGKRSEVIPMAPDLARFLLRHDQTGRVVKTNLALRSIKEILKEAGELAGILVSKNKHATAQDFRRTFGQRWALRVHPMVLKTMMRHRSLATTEKYYVDIKADDIASHIWPNVRASVHSAVQFAKNSEQRWLKTSGKSGT